MFSPRRRLAVIALASALALGGCTVGGEKKPEARPTPAAPSASTPQKSNGAQKPTGASDAGGATATATLPPANADLEPPKLEDYPHIKENTDEGAKDATRYFFDAMYYGYSTGDSSPLSSVSDMTECEICRTLADEIDTKYGPSKMALNNPHAHSGETVVTRHEGNRTAVYYTYELDAHARWNNGKYDRERPLEAYQAAALLEYSKTKGWQIIGAEWRVAKNQ